MLIQISKIVEKSFLYIAWTDCQIAYPSGGVDAAVGCFNKNPVSLHADCHLSASLVANDVMMEVMPHVGTRPSPETCLTLIMNSVADEVSIYLGHYK